MVKWVQYENLNTTKFMSSLGTHGGMIEHWGPHPSKTVNLAYTSTFGNGHVSGGFNLSGNLSKGQEQQNQYIVRWRLILLAPKVQNLTDIKSSISKVDFTWGLKPS